MRTFLVACLLAAPLLAADQPSPDAVKRGQLAFKAACGFCHGDDATGSRAPDLIRSATLSHDVNGEQLGPVIRNGRPDKGMPGFPCRTIKWPTSSRFCTRSSWSRCTAIMWAATIPWRNC